MKNINLTDTNKFHDCIAHGVVQITDDKGNILLRKSNMITRFGRKFILSKVRNAKPYSNYELAGVFVGDNYDVTTPDMEWNPQNKNIYKIAETENMILSESVSSSNMVNEIDYVEMKSYNFYNPNENNKLIYKTSLTIRPQKDASTNGRYYVETLYGDRIYLSITDSNIYNNTTGKFGYKADINKFITIDGSIATIRQYYYDVDSATELSNMNNLKNFMDTFKYAQIVDINGNSNLTTYRNFISPNGDNMEKAVNKYFAIPYEPERFNYSLTPVTFDGVTYVGVTVTPTARNTVDSAQTFITNTLASLSDDPYIKLSYTFDGQLINKNVTELGLLIDDPNAYDLYTELSTGLEIMEKEEDGQTVYYYKDNLQNIINPNFIKVKFEKNILHGSTSGKLYKDSDKNTYAVLGNTIYIVDGEDFIDTDKKIICMESANLIDTRLFSRVIFEPVPMVPGNKFKLTYYVYF